MYYRRSLCAHNRPKAQHLFLHISLGLLIFPHHVGLPIRNGEEVHTIVMPEEKSSVNEIDLIIFVRQYFENAACMAHSCAPLFEK